MDALNLLYLTEYQVLICQDCGYALTPIGYERHLRRLHGTKGEALHAAILEVEDLELRRPNDLPVFPHGLRPIQGLKISPGFRCALPACNVESDALSKHRRTVEKHQSRIHKVSKTSTRKSTPQDIEIVCMQSFFVNQYYRPFIVSSDSTRPASPSGPSTVLHAAALDADGIDASVAVWDAIQSRYQASQQDWWQAFGELPDLEQSRNTTPPWLKETGIAEYIHRQSLNKAALRALAQPPTYNRLSLSVEALLGQGVRYSLHTLRRKSTLGKREASLGRTTARIMNSFEPDRMQSKPFKVVKEDSTLERYADYWTGLILFLHRISTDSDCLSLREELLNVNSRVRRHLQRTWQAVEELHAANTSSIAVADCFHPKEAGESDDEDSDTDENSDSDASTQSRLRTLACRVVTMVRKLSISLVRHNYDGLPFSSGVVAYCAVGTITSDDTWIVAQRYSPFLSGMIHCMQLWLLAYCYDEHDRAEEGVSLRQIVAQQCKDFLVNDSDCPTAELSFWRTLSWTASNDTVQHPTTTVDTDRMRVAHPGVDLGLDEWRRSLQRGVVEARATLEDDLLLGLDEAPRYPASTLQDTPTDHRPGRCFIDDPRNQLHAAKDWLFHQLHANPRLRQRFFREDATDSSSPPAPRPAAVNRYLHADQGFLRQLVSLFYMTAGLPPRRKELATILWCNEESARNLYIYQGTVAIITGYGKSEWRIGTRPTARFLPPGVGDLYVRYVIYVLSFRRFLHDCMRLPTARGLLFSSSTSGWTGDQVGASIKRWTTCLLGDPISSRQWRHIAIALDRRLLRGVGCRTYGVSPQWGQRALHAAGASDSELDAGYDPQGDFNPDTTPSTVAHHWQASHGPTTGTLVYGNDLNLLGGMTDGLLAAFKAVSERWWELASMVEVACGETAGGSKRPGSLSLSNPRPLKQTPFFPLSSQLSVRREMWNWPALQRGLCALLGPEAHTRSPTQRDGLSMIARSYPETIIVMPTGSGKTILYIVPTLLQQAEVTVVIVPLIALKHDLLRRCQQWRLTVACFDSSMGPDQVHTVPSLVLVDIDVATSPSFLRFVQGLHAVGRLDRLILDEAHLLLTASHYRERIGLLGVLRRVRCPFVCMTGTLPPSAEFILKDNLFFTCTRVLRTGCDRPNLRYCVQSLRPNLDVITSRQDILLHAAVTVCSQDVGDWLREGDTAARGICFVRTKRLGQKLASSLGCHLYTSDLPDMERPKVLTAWNLGQHSPYIVATASFGAGVDCPSVRRIVHVDAPAGLVDYAQETGRAGRDGLPAVCLTLLAKGWGVTWDTGYVSDFLTEDRTQMTNYLRSSRCLRQHLTAYLDGGSGTPCSGEQDDSVVRRLHCSSCESSSVPDTSASTLPEAVQLTVRQSPKANRVTPRISPDLPVAKRSLGSDRQGSEPGSDLLSTETESEEEEEDRSVDQDTYDVAAQLARSDSMQVEKAREHYERRVAHWGRACIPCSFAQRRLVDGTHKDCLQHSGRKSMSLFRTDFKFESFTGCFRCGQPAFICMQRGKKGCTHPNLLFHACWVVALKDRVYGHRMVEALGGPSILPNALYVPTELAVWLGKKIRFLDQEASNAVRLLHQWLDRLEALCVQSSSG